MGAASIHADVVSVGMSRALGDPTLGYKPWGAGSEQMLLLAWAKYARDSVAGLGMMLVGLTVLPVGIPDHPAKN